LEEPSSVKRLINLDLLRGVSAIGIMVYHYLTWMYGEYSADTMFGRIGVYGVSVFYVLSGLTLFHVYYERMKPSGVDVRAFFKKRILRIFPLLWLATGVSVLLSWKAPDPQILMLNLTGLFGFFSWDTYLSGGVWSIGNELVFYVFFPFFVFFSKRNIAIMVVLSVALFGLYLYFSFGVLPSCPEPEQWRNYINPLNQVFLFLGGFLVGLFFKNQRYKNGVLVIVLLASVFLFVFYPVFGPQFAVKTGFNRLVFTSLCLVICFCFYKISMPLPRLVGRGFSFLGEISYSVYLLHPHVYDLMGRFRFQVYPISGYARTGISIVLTLVVSYFVYRYFERVFMRLGSTSTQQGF